MTRFGVGVVGSIDRNTELRYNPYVHLSVEGMHDFLRALASEPMDIAHVARTYPTLVASVEGLIEIGALRKEDGRIWINFTVFTGDDEVIINDICRRNSRQMAEAIDGKRDTIRAVLGQYHAGTVTVPQLAYAIVGALTLDVACLTWLPDWGYMLRGKEQPGGNNYTLWANERTQTLDLRGVFWGCHWDEAGSYRLFTFGDHAPTTKRRALPDELWRVVDRAAQDAPPGLAKSIGDWGDGVARDAAEMLAWLRDRPAGAGEPADSAQTLAILRDYGYVLGCDDSLQLAVPMFIARDSAMVQEVQTIVGGVVRDYLSSSYARLREELLAARLTPLRHGVSFDEVFVQLWHYIFGFANQQLSASGFSFDPYVDGRWPGFMPAACDKSLFAAPCL